MILKKKIQALALMATLKCREWQRPETILAAQDKKLRRILKAACQFPFYRRLFETHQIIPESTTREDLQRLPIVTKDIMRKQFEELIGRQPKNQKTRLVRTTGSTGTPLSIITSHQENRFAQILSAYAFRKSGLKFRDTLVFLHVGREEELNRSFLQRLGITPLYALNLQADFPYIYDRLKKLQPQVLCSYPSYLTLLGKYLRENGLCLPSVRLIFTGGELLTPKTRHVLQTLFGARVRNIYATEELGRITYECEYDHMHVIPDAAIVEIINQDEHGMGDAVITSLFRERMPIIRYLIGDRMKLSNECCPCGVPFQIIEDIEGRCDDFLVLPSGRRISARAINVLEDVPGILEYQTIQKAPGYFEVRLQKNHQFTEASADLIRERIREGCLGEEVEVQVLVEESLTRERTGKLRAVISEVTASDE